MDYNTPLIEGRLLKRYKRFFADVQVEQKGQSQTVVAHVPNTGSLKGVSEPSRPCRLQTRDEPGRKLKFSLEQIKAPTSWVGVNTHVANTLVAEAFAREEIPHWSPYQDVQREVKINPESRLDLKLTAPNREPHFVEIKSVTLADGNTALFPDAVTTRGQKHLLELMKIQREKVGSTEILFVVQRTDCESFSPADAIDPEYGKLLREAHHAGVLVTAYPVHLSEDRITLNTKTQLKIIF